MKPFKKYLLSLALLLLLAPVASAKSFSDVPTTSSNYNAIEYLHTLGVIEGYTDQTYRPLNKVNRAEFLKIVLEGSDIETNISNPTPFPDVDNSAWYAPYVRKAYSEKWVEGYTDGTFKPENPINRVEALKIVGIVQEWKLPESITKVPYKDTARLAWYTPYVSFSKDHNLLEERTSYFGPAVEMSRASISELLFRTHITFTNDEEIYDLNFINKYPATAEQETVSTSDPKTTTNTPEPNIDAPPLLNFEPVIFSTYPSDFFDNVTLNESFPNNFYLNELYFIEGNVNSGTADKAFVFLAPEGETDGTKFLNYVTSIQNGSFSIPVFFRETGNYKMGMIVGSSGESFITNISVLPSLPVTVGNQESSVNVSTLNIKYLDQNTSFSWNGSNNTLKRLIIYQGSDTVLYYLRQNKDSINIDYRDFENFEEGTVYARFQTVDLDDQIPLQLSSNWSAPAELMFSATVHHPSDIDKTLISTNFLPELFKTVQKIEFSGTAHGDIFVEAAVIKPDGLVDLFDLTSNEPLSEYYGSPTIKNGNSYTFSYTPKTKGTYMIEIVGIDGSAVVNTPVYIDNGVPLLPDYFDLNTNPKTEEGFLLASARTELLNLINNERETIGLPPVVLDNDLNSLALNHSNDMVNQDFFHHINPDGATPEDRRKAANIATQVGENLAIAPTLEYTHEGLMLSAIHRNNILDPKWQRVGIGIVQKSNGSLITTQEFSNYPPTESALEEMRTRIVDTINKERVALGEIAFSIDSEIQDIAEIWSLKMVEENFFDFISPNGETLSSLVSNRVPDKPVQAIIVEGTNEEKVVEKVLEIGELGEPQWQKIGFGLEINSIGILKGTLLFTTD